VAETNIDQILIRGTAENRPELPDQLGAGQEYLPAQPGEVDRVPEARMQNVFGDTQSPVNLFFCGRFDGVDALGEAAVPSMGAEEVAQEENQFFIGALLIVAGAVKSRYQVGQASGERGFDGVKGLKKFRFFIAVIERVVEKLIFQQEFVMENGGGKFFLEENGQYVRKRAFVDAAGVCLIVVQDKEPAATDGQLMAIESIPFFARENGLQ